MGFQTEPLEEKIDKLQTKVDKLKRLLLLTDHEVSYIVVGRTQLKQWKV